MTGLFASVTGLFASVTGLCACVASLFASVTGLFASAVECGARVGHTVPTHRGVELRGNLKSISHRCHLEEVASVWELTKETIHLPLGCLQSGNEITTQMFYYY